MKRILFTVCLSMIMIFSVSVGWSAPVVGPWNYTSPTDSILGYESLGNANEATELAFANNVLALLGMGTAALYNGTGAKYTFPDSNSKETAYDPGFAWDYAVVKVDGPNDFSYLFWDNQAGGGDDILTTPLHGTNPFNIGNIPNGYGISHITWFVDPSEVRVPEPSTLILLGIGLAGLAGIKRKLF